MSNLMDMQYESVCTACGEKLHKNNIAFSELDLLPYHKNMTQCDRRHPNSYENHAKRRGHMVKMLTVAEAQHEWRMRRLKSLDSADVESVMKMLKAPTTLRIDTVENAAYIVQVANEDRTSISEAIRKMISDHREASGKDVLKFTDTPDDVQEDMQEITVHEDVKAESNQAYTDSFAILDDELNNF